MSLGQVVTVVVPLLPTPLLPASLLPAHRQLLHPLPRLHLPRPLQLITGVRPPAVNTRAIRML
jgi:hypothetical protein